MAWRIGEFDWGEFGYRGFLLCVLFDIFIGQSFGSPSLEGIDNRRIYFDRFLIYTFLRDNRIDIGLFIDGRDFLNGKLVRVSLNCF